MFDWFPPLIKAKQYPPEVQTDYEKLAWDRLQSHKQWRAAQATALAAEFRINGVPSATITLAEAKLLTK